MLLLLRYHSGETVTGILLTASHDHIRVAIPNRTDITEFRLRKRKWVCDEGYVAEIEAVACGAGPNPVILTPQVRHAA